MSIGAFRSTPLIVIAVGDMAFNGHYHHLLGEQRGVCPLAAIVPQWKNADLRLGNLESPVTAARRVSPSRCVLRGAPGTIDVLRHADFDCVSIANNHAMDFGAEGLLETRAKLMEAGVACVGAGETQERASTPVILERGGNKIGLLAFCNVEQSSPLYAGPTSAGVASATKAGMVSRIRQLRSRVDWVIVQLHWGLEMSQLPMPEQRGLARELVRAGADLILGHHPHVLEPVEVISGVPIFYSLGNLLESEMYWRGRNQRNQAFVSKLRLHPLSRRTGWAEVRLRKDAPTTWRMCFARLGSDYRIALDETLARQREWVMLGQMLRAPNWREITQAESERARARSAWRWTSRSLARWVELKLFSFGLIPNAVEGH